LPPPNPRRILGFFKIIIPAGVLVYAIRKFSLDYKKPKFEILKIQSDTNKYSREDVFCFIKLRIFNPACFDNTIYLSVKSLFNSPISPFFGPDETDTKIIVPANNDVIHVFHAFTPISRDYQGKFIKICVTDSKGKVSSKYRKWQGSET
jgi:hypothetical protein